MDNTYRSQGLSILGFPCNQFGAQEPDNEPEIKAFVQTYGVTFDMFSKVEVNGRNAHGLYKFLRFEGMNSAPITWNFGKFLVDKQGKVVKYFEPKVAPLSMVPDIERLL